MAMRLRTVVFATLVLAGAAAPAAAQARPTGLRSGPWVTVGVGGGWTRVNCSICRTDRNAGPAASLRLGTTLRPGLLIGAELDGWTRAGEDVRTLVAAGSAAAYIYPDPSRGLFLKAGAGVVRYSFNDEDDASANLLGIMLGAGYEFPISDELNITNSVGLIASSFGALRSDAGTIVDDMSISLFHIGIALTHR